MNENMKLICDAKEMIKAASSMHCDAYSELCSSRCAEAILSVLDGELRMTDQLSKLEMFYSSAEAEHPANEYEVNKFLSSQGSPSKPSAARS